MNDITLSKKQLRVVEDSQFRAGIFCGSIFAIILALIGYTIYSGGLAFVNLFLI